VLWPASAPAAEAPAGGRGAAPAAVVPTWIPIGPPGTGPSGVTSAVSFCTAPSQVAYAGAYHSGVLRSEDGGAHWAPARTGLQDATVWALQVSPDDCSVAYAATDSAVVLTLDGGVSWHDASAGLASSFVRTFVLDPYDRSSLYVAADAGLFHTRFGRTAWSAVWLPAVALVSAAIDPLSRSTLYAGVADPYGGRLGGIYKSTDGGRTWVRANSNAHKFVTDGGAFNLMFDPTAPTTLYAISGCCDNGHHLFKTTDGARTWTPVTVLGSAVTSLSASADGTLYATVGGYRPSLFLSHDHGASWQVPAGGAPPDYLFRVTAAPGDSSRLLAWGERRLWGSADGGGHWRTSDAGLAAHRVYTVTSAADGSLYVGADDGWYRKARLGRDWQRAHFGALLAIDPRRPETLYASSPEPSLKYEYGRSVDGGATWSEFYFPDYYSSLIVDPSSSERLYSVSSPISGNDFRCFSLKSLDTGATWSCIDYNGFELFLIDPRHPATLYGTSGFLLSRSDDGGATWSLVNLENSIYALAIDPSRTEVLYAATDQGLLRTTDQGRSWHPWSTALTSSGIAGSPNQLIVDPRSSSRLYAGVPGRGIFGSVDGGVTWNQLGQGLPAELVTGAFALDPLLPATLYAGTNGQGTFRLDLEP